MANIFHVERDANKITLGVTGTTINVASHTASKILALDASKNLEVVTIGTSLNYARPTLNTIQDIRTTASPQFASIELGHADDTTITRVSGGVIAVEGTTVMMVGDAPTSHTHDDRYYTETEIGDNYQPLSAVLTNLADLFISGQNHLEFQSANNYIYGYTISQLHLISTGEIHLIAGGAYSLKVIHDLGCLFNAGIYITEQASASGSTATYGQLWTKSGTPNTLWFTDDTGGDFQLGVGGGAHTHDGDTLQLDGINSDGGAFAFTTSGAITFNQNLIIPDGGTIGQSAGPLLTFDDSNNYLEITGCKVGIGESTPNKLLHITGIDTGTSSFDGNANIIIEDTDTSWLYFMSDVAGIAGIAWGDTEDTFRASIDYNHDGDYLRFYSNNTERMRIGSTGIVSIEGTLTLKERASADGDTAAYGQVWVKNTDPCELWFTDDAGTDTKVVPSFGAWVSRSNNTSYEAATDGFVLAYSTDAASSNVIGLTDGSDPPTTTRINSKSTNVIDAGNSIASITMPVKRGDFWKVTGATTVTWMPIGTT